MPTPPEDSRTASYESDDDSSDLADWARLVMVHPPAAEAVIDLHPGATVIGRDRLTLPGGQRTVSRRHYEFRVENGRVVGRDLESRNGSSVNGVSASSLPRPLEDGDVLRFGDAVGVLEVGNDPLSADNAEVLGEAALPGQSAAMHRLRNDVRRAATDRSPVLIIGETGTGKEWAARALHETSAATGDFVTTNCATLNASLIESQLFGHERGAFTGAATAEPGLFRTADRGTLFLDEVGEIPLELQAKLLRAVELGEVQPVGSSRPIAVNTRVIAATNRELGVEVEQGRFRRDLLARLSLHVVRLPPLSARRADIPGWLRRLRERWASNSDETEFEPLEFSAEAIEKLLLYTWPQNLRGLDQLVHTFSVRDEATVVQRADLPGWVGGSSGNVSAGNAGKAPVATRLAPRARPSRDELAEMLQQHQWNIAAVAAGFGRARRQVYRWMEHYGFERNESSN